MRKILWAALALVLIPGLAWSAPAVDHGLWDELVKKHVQGEAVDYAGFQSQEKELDSYLDLLARVDHEALEGNERYAFLINLYNAWTIKLILTKWPDLKSIKDLGSILSSPWKKKIVVLSTGKVHLDNVEHDMLRPESKDPRIHFAVNCASKGCPPLAPFAFTGAELDQQLDRVTTAFINDPQRTILEGDQLKVTRIMKWYGEDFGDKAAFVKKYAQEDLKSGLEAAGDKVRISYLDYDWSLNGK